MNRIPLALLGIAALILAQMACNLPVAGTPQAPQLPAPNQTLTALFSAATSIAGENATVTLTLPPVITSTSQEESGGGQGPTATLVNPTPTVTNTPAPTSTPTTRPSNTSVPQPTNTSAPVVTRKLFTAKYLATPPVIDGDWSEWKSITTEYPANYVVFGKSNWTGEDDLSSSFHIGWDKNYLYIAVKVRDDKYVQNASGADIYKGDSLEILLDTKLQTDIFYDALSPDDFQLGISPGRPDPNGTKEAYLWFPSNIAGSRSEVKIGSRLETGIYRVEVAIPWSVFETTPANGRHFGFALSVSDNDNPHQNVQQSMVSNVPDRHLTDPTTWGELQLVK
ncbi:MAG TPA: sugar-binding protein [Anaerolineaceae bacterium]